MIAPVIAITMLLLFSVTEGFSFGLLFIVMMAYEIREGIKEGRSRQDR